MATKKAETKTAVTKTEPKEKPYMFEGVELKFTDQGKTVEGRKVPFKNLKTIKALQVDADGNITGNVVQLPWELTVNNGCLLYTSPSPRDVEESRMPSSA